MTTLVEPLCALQRPAEQFRPAIVLEHLSQTYRKDQLIKILTWIALHPDGGDDKAVDELSMLGMGNGPSDMEQARERVALYGVKLLGRMLGKIKGT